MKKMFALFCTLTLSFFYARFFKCKSINLYTSRRLGRFNRHLPFLNKDCGYEQISKSKIERALMVFSRSQQWDVSNYSILPMSQLNEDSYNDLKGIEVPHNKKCQLLANKSLSLLNY